MFASNIESKEKEIRLSWTMDSLCLIFSRSDKKWYDGKIEKVITSNNDKQQSKQLANEWLIVRYKNNKKIKKIQRNCNDIKPIPKDHNSSLKTGSFCLIHSNIINLWCKGEILSVFNDEEGEWLKVKYWDTNDHKICDIQRYSKQLKVFNDKLLYEPIIKIAIPRKPWKLIETDIPVSSMSNPVALNDNEFVIAPWHSYDMNEEERKNNGIYKYNIDRNEWKLYILYPDEFISIYHNMSIDYEQEIIYLLHGYDGFTGGGIWKIDIKTKKFEHYALENECDGAIGYVDHNSKLDIFWGNKHNKHILWESNNNKQMDVIYEWNELKKGMVSFGMIYNWMEKYFLLFGGFRGKGVERSDEIWKYYINEKKWEKLQVKMPKKMQSFGSVITSNCKYVLVLGGSDKNGLLDDIYILNLSTMQWTESQIICPFKGVGFSNVILTVSNNIEYIHLLQGQYALIAAPISDILSANPLMMADEIY